MIFCESCYFTAAQAKAIGYSYQAQGHHVAAPSVTSGRGRSQPILGQRCISSEPSSGRRHHDLRDTSGLRGGCNADGTRAGPSSLARLQLETGMLAELRD